MLAVIKDWFHRYFSDPEAVLLAVLLILGFGLIFGSGSMLAPLIASVIIAYLLRWMVNGLVRYKIPELVAVVIVYVGFLGLFFGGLLILWPIVWRQFAHLVDEMPTMINSARDLLYLIPERFPDYVSRENIDDLIYEVIKQARNYGKSILSVSISSIPSIIALIIYLILVPLMVFFFLKDAKKITSWCTSFLPNKRPLLEEIWNEVDDQMGNYVRGKVAEVLIIGISTYLVLVFFKLPYALLLASLVGLSVLIPYVGAMVVTIPIVVVAFFKWGLENQFYYVTVAYLIIQILDGNVLVPLLFSEAVNLHPIAIIVAILVFGGLWGFWGVFFAIPLATLVKAVINAWPRDGQLAQA